MNSATGGRTKRNREERRRVQDDRLQREYSGISFSSRQSSGRPGTPHRYFEASYAVLSRPTGTPIERGGCTGNGAAAEIRVQTKPSSIDTTDQAHAAKYCETEKRDSMQQIIHRHANGLCIVTAGKIVKKACESCESCELPPSEATKEARSPIHVAKVEFAVQAMEGQSVGSKRRKKMAKANNNKGSSVGIARPSGKLARIELSNGSCIDLDCCVVGTILEINKKLLDTPSLLVDDPLFDGYLAVIIPEGPFPFPPVLSDTATNT